MGYSKRRNRVKCRHRSKCSILHGRLTSCRRLTIGAPSSSVCRVLGGVQRDLQSMIALQIVRFLSCDTIGVVGKPYDWSGSQQLWGIQHPSSILGSVGEVYSWHSAWSSSSRPFRGNQVVEALGIYRSSSELSRRRTSLDQMLT